MDPVQPESPRSLTITLTLLTMICLFATFYLSVMPPLAAMHLLHRQAGLKNARESQCAVCPGDIEIGAASAYLAFDQATNEGITLCTYKESSGTEIVCPYVTDTGNLNGAVTYCPQTVALKNCVNG